MKKMKSANIALSFLASLSLLLTGCNLNNEPKEQIVETSPLSGDYAATIALDDPSLADMNITYEEYLREYSFYVLLKEAEETEESQSDDTAKLKRDVVDGLINNKRIMKYAEQSGIIYETLTDEEKNEIEENTDYFIEQLAEDYGRESGTESYEERLDEFFEEMDLSRNIINDWMKESVIERTLYNEVMADVTVSQDEVETSIKELTAIVTQSYWDNVDTFLSDYGNFDYYIPDGTRSADIISVSFDYERLKQIYDLRDSSDDEGADKLLNESLPEIKGTVDDIVKKLKNGESASDLAELYADESTVAFYIDNPFIPENDDLGVFKMSSPGEVKVEYDDQGYLIVVYGGLFTRTEQDDEALFDKIMQEIQQGRMNERSKKFVEELEEKFPFNINYELLGIEPETTESEEESSEIIAADLEEKSINF